MDHSFTNCFVLAFSKNETSPENKRKASTASAERKELIAFDRTQTVYVIFEFSPADFAMSGGH